MFKEKLQLRIKPENRINLTSKNIRQINKYKQMNPIYRT